MLHNLDKYNILLASKSPRRRELLEQLGLPFRQISIRNVEETYPADMDVERVAEYLSQTKADAYLESMQPDDLVITADTVVILDGKIFGKPADREGAIEMLMTLSGRTHKVCTGVTISTTARSESFSIFTEVEFSEIYPEDAEYYVDTYHPYDKAGAYGIQEWIGCVAVKALYGSYYNVMGLPVNQLYSRLKHF